jgi:hypothetical protein
MGKGKKGHNGGGDGKGKTGLFVEMRRKERGGAPRGDLKEDGWGMGMGLIRFGEQWEAEVEEVEARRGTSE